MRQEVRNLPFRKALKVAVLDMHDKSAHEEVLSLETILPVVNVLTSVDKVASPTRNCAICLLPISIEVFFHFNTMSLSV